MTQSLPWVPVDRPLNLTCVSVDIVTEEALEEFLDVLRAHPGQCVAWSQHRSRGAARQRIHSLRRSARFRDHPGVRFESRTAVPNDPESPVYILVSWDQELADAAARPTDLETRLANKHRMDPGEVAAAARKVWGHSLDAERDALAGVDATPQRRGVVARQLFERLTDVVAI